MRKNAFQEHGRGARLFFCSSCLKQLPYQRFTPKVRTKSSRKSLSILNILSILSILSKPKVQNPIKGSRVPGIKSEFFHNKNVALMSLIRTNFGLKNLVIQNKNGQQLIPPSYHASPPDPLHTLLSPAPDEAGSPKKDLDPAAAEAVRALAAV